MAIRRYYASKDNTITNAFDPFDVRATGSNMGQADILEVFSLYKTGSNVTDTEAQQLMRFLVQFPTADINTDRTNSKIPASGNVSFYLNLYNAPHSNTTPFQYTLQVYPLSRSWEEGRGLDMEEFADQTLGGLGSNWVNAASGVAWTNQGGDYLTSSVYEQYFETGFENLSVNITPLVEQWLSGTQQNYGVLVKLTSSNEAYYSNSSGVTSASVPFNPNGATTSYYTKKFFARSSEYFFYRPNLEARWNDAVKDERSGFYASSSNLPAQQNLHSIYLYNYYRGKLYDIPTIGTGNIYVKVYTDPTGSGTIAATPNNPVTGTWVKTGVYKASFALNTTASQVFDRWFDSTLTTCYYTGSIDIIDYEPSEPAPYQIYVNKITNMKPSYSKDEVARFRIFTRDKNWSPNIYNVANSYVEPTIIESGSYKIYRLVDDLEIVSFSTGSEKFSELSYDVSGNYFDFNMSILEQGYSYGIKIAYYNGDIDSYVEQPEIFKFKVI
jgi:hypothetical protein